MNDAWNMFRPVSSLNRRHGRRSGAHSATPLLVETPLIDMVELPEGVCLYCNIPGTSPDGISLTVEGEFLYLRAEAGYEPIRGKIHALEFSDTFYEGRILLPPVDASRIEASLANGLLRVFMPFQARKKAVRIPVAAG